MQSERFMQGKYGLFFLVVMFCLSLWPFQAVSASQLVTQRMHFKDARVALKAGDMQHYNILYNKLKGYPLRPYLDIWQAWKGLDVGLDFDVVEVLQRYQDVPESVDLQMAWIKSLAERGQWPHVAIQLKALDISSQQLPEIVLLSAWYNGDKQTAFDALSEIWAQGQDIDAVQAPFMQEEWRKAGYPQVSDSLKRAKYFALRGHWDDVEILKKGFEKSDRHWLSYWEKVQDTPQKYLSDFSKQKLDANDTWAKIVLSDGLQRLSRQDVKQAWAVLEKLQVDVAVLFFEKMQQKIALRAAKQHVPHAAQWLASLGESVQNSHTYAWRVRMLLMQEDWQQALLAIQAMPEQQQLESRWMYWQAQALDMLKQEVAAKLIYEQLAEGRGYYSFLSSEHLGLAYRMGWQKAEAISSRRLVKEMPMRRAYEWLQLGEEGKASREWFIALKGASVERWRQALQLAVSWKWYDRAIQAASRAGVYDALAVRFPMGHADAVQGLAHETGLEASLIWSVIRQESAFNASAVSRVGARGLMQLMPRTAKYVAKKHGLDSPNLQELIVPEFNIQLGANYLADLLKRFEGEKAVAIAAYNAGPTRVAQWQGRFPFRRSDIWIELIPFKETRQYVQQVMAFTAVYDFLQKKQTTGLLTRASEDILRLESAPSL